MAQRLRWSLWKYLLCNKLSVCVVLFLLWWDPKCDAQSCLYSNAIVVWNVNSFGRWFYIPQEGCPQIRVPDTRASSGSVWYFRDFPVSILHRLYKIIIVRSLEPPKKLSCVAKILSRDLKNNSKLLAIETRSSIPRNFGCA